MLSPAMATMLAVVTTDAAIERRARCNVRWRRAVAESFDCLSVDGCRSTNDTVLVLADGQAGAVDPHTFTDALDERVRVTRRADGA